MPARVTLDDMEMRARMRPLRHARPPKQRDGWGPGKVTYVRRPVPEPSHKLFQDVEAVSAFQFPAAFSQPSQTTDVFADTDPGVNQPALAPSRQPFPAKRRIPAPSLVLKRESFIIKPPAPEPKPEPQAEAFFIRTTPRPELHRSFEPPAKSRPAWLLRARRKPGVLIVRLKRTVRAMPRQQRLLTGLAALVLVAGTAVSLSGVFGNHAAKLKAAQASLAVATSATTTNSRDSAPSTAPVTADTLRAYRVAPEAARYISIPKLGVLARVLQVGMTKDGALATPSNVFDTAWYKQSAQPGQPGATLIDGHVSSWTTNGVFYGIKKLVAGDTIQIERGDGQKLSYAVVKTVTYPADAVDMGSLMKPVTPGKSGLNLITCGGKYDSKSGEFTQRIAVYATLND
jgi:sortase (surface protein transpeptidase)